MALILLKSSSTEMESVRVKSKVSADQRSLKLSKQLPPLVKLTLANLCTSTAVKKLILDYLQVNQVATLILSLGQ